MGARDRPDGGRSRSSSGPSFATMSHRAIAPDARGVRVPDSQRAVQHGEAGVACLERIGQVRIDPARAVVRQLEERPVQPRTEVQVLVVPHARHHRQMVEHRRGAEEEMIPVGPFVTTIDEVAGQDDEVHARMPAHRALQQPAPALQAGLGVAQVEEPQRAILCRRGLHDLPGSPSLGRPVAQGVLVDAVGLESAHGDPVPPDDRIVEHARDFDAGRVALHDRASSPRRG